MLRTQCRAWHLMLQHISTKKGSGFMNRKKVIVLLAAVVILAVSGVWIAKLFVRVCKSIAHDMRCAWSLAGINGTTGEPIDTNCNGNNTKQEKQRSNIAGDNRESSDTSICESLERIFPFHDMRFTRCRSLLLIKNYKTQPPAKPVAQLVKEPSAFAS